MRFLRSFQQAFEAELVRLLERGDDLLAGDHHRVGLINSAFHLNEARVILV